MQSSFLTVLNLTEDERENPQAPLKHALEKLLTVEDWAHKAFEAFKDVKLPDDFETWVQRVAPWLGLVGKAVPPVDAAFEVVRWLTKEQDPSVLLYLACTAAYQAAAAKALKELGTLPERSINQRLADATGTDVKTFKYFTVKSLMTSPFKRGADRVFSFYARQVYSLDVVDGARRLIDLKFPDEFRSALAHGKNLEKFAPARAYLEMDSDGAAAREALCRHADYCKWLYEGAAVLGEPYALKDIHVDTGCGMLTFKQVREKTGEDGRRRRDPFRREEEHGGCKPFLDAVLGLLHDPKFSDAIVIQGVAGSGKSTFVKQLAATLADEGLQPLFVRLRDVKDWNKDFFTVLGDAVPLQDKEYLSCGSERWPWVKNTIWDGMFYETRSFLGIDVCPYVLILDGWDEISAVGTESFRNRLDQFLNWVRKNVLGTGVKVGVVLTGRPSDVVDGAEGFYRNETRVLTVRQFEPKQLREYAERLREALAEKRLGGALMGWTMLEQAALAPLFERYDEDYDKLSKAKEGFRDGAILGIPFLAHLAFRVAAEPGGDVAALASDQTLLLRRVTDLVVLHSDRATEEYSGGGFAGEARDPVESRIEGPKLRRLLRRLATAMTHSSQEVADGRALKAIFAKENIPGHLQDAKFESNLTALVMSFYLKGGAGSEGCEFTHKSLREFLFAEAVVESLKGFGGDYRNTVTLPKRPRAGADFDSQYEIFRWSREMAMLLCPQRLTPEVQDHLWSLLQWELERGGDGAGEAGEGCTTALSMEGWKWVRDGLAELWGWWAEAVPMRPQAAYSHGVAEWKTPLYYDLILDNHELPQSNHSRVAPHPPLNEYDGNLGFALLQLTAVMHDCVAHVAAGETSDVDYVLERQRVVERDGMHCVLFHPGMKLTFEQDRTGAEQFARMGGIQSFGLRLALPSVSLLGVELSGAKLMNADLRRADLTGAALNGANLSRAKLMNADLRRADLRGAGLMDAHLRGAGLMNADLRGANLRGANLRGANLMNADLRRADLTEADLSGAKLIAADLSNADLDGADLRDAALDGANLRGAIGMNFAETRGTPTWMTDGTAGTAEKLRRARA